VIAGRYEVGDLRRGDDAAALREGVDVLIGRRVLLEMVPGGQPRTIELDHPGWRAPKLSGNFDGIALVVHDWAPGKPVLPPDDAQASAQIDRLLAVLAALAAAGKVHGGIVPESVALDGAGHLTSLGSTLAASNLLTSPGTDAIALAGVLAHALTGSPALPSVAPSTALLAAARQTRPGLVSALTPLVALVHTPTVRRSSARKRRAMAAGVAFALAGGGTAAALVARSITEPATRQGAIPPPESLFEQATTTVPSSSTRSQASPVIRAPALEPPSIGSAPGEPPIEFGIAVEVLSGTAAPVLVTQAPSSIPIENVPAGPPPPPLALAPVSSDPPPVRAPVEAPTEPPVLPPPPLVSPPVKPPVERPAGDDDDDDDDEDAGHGHHDGARRGHRGDHDGEQHDHDDDHAGDGEHTPAPER
jgi:hypothetical protein